jgi:V/A-type H+-transporting ATPase subunit I
MLKLLAVVLEDYTDPVTELLLKEGVIQFISTAQMDMELSEKLNEVDPSHSLAKIAEMRRRIQVFLDTAGIAPEPPGEIDLENRKLIDLDSESRELDRIADDLNGIRERQRAVWQEILKLEEMKRQVEPSGIDYPKEVLESRHPFISIRFGKVTSQGYESIKAEMKDLPYAAQVLKEKDGLSQVFLIYMKSDRDNVEKLLKRVDWSEAELPADSTGLKGDITPGLEKKIKALYKERDLLGSKARTYIEQKSESLNKMWVQVRINELFSEIKSYYKRSSRTVVFSGWLPASKRILISEGIRKATGGKCYLEWFEPGKNEQRGEKEASAPVKFKNPKFLSPFQMLVTNFGVPEYGTIDPTPFVVFTYLIMFGLMFADVGQGALLALAGMAGTLLFKEKQETWRNLSKLIIWCGFASIITGFLFGSYFGMGLLKPLWFDYHGIISGHVRKQSYINDIFDILAITVYFGIAVIGTGLLFNWINLTIKKRWTELIFDKGGITGGWFFGGGIYVAMYLIDHDYRGVPGVLPLFLLVGLPAILLYMKAPLRYFEKKKSAKNRFTIMTLFDFGMQWVVELLEVFSGYLSNTLSFMRVAGLGIAHVSLMIAFFEIASLVNEGSQAAMGNPLSIIILVIGNILVIGLEGLTAGIQALRLNYYEFFTKFFSGSGVVFSPISLKRREY